MEKVLSKLRKWLGYDLLLQQRLEILDKVDKIEHQQTQILELLVDLRSQAGLESELGVPTVIETLTEFDPLGV